jgi:hypothetical protein
MSDEQEPEQQQNSAGENGKINLFPANPPEHNPVVEEEKPARRLSGFASPDYWDGIDSETGLTRREAKSLWAKKMNSEGRFGGRQPGAGRPRSKSVAEVVTEKASEKADQIARELVSMATQHKSPSVKLGAIDRINKFEQDLEKNMRDDEKELRKLSGKSLDEKLAELLQEHNVGYDIDLPPDQIEDIDGD